MKLTYLILGLNVIPAYGATFAQWGIASEHPSKEASITSVKFGEIGLSGEQGKLAYTAGVGYWMDTTGYRSQGNLFVSDRAENSWFVETLYGVEPHCGPVYLTYKLGPAIITHPDPLLGSNLQIAHELGFGLRDSRGVRVGIVLKHFSNAGIVRPNLGRDFVGLRIEF